LLDCRRLDPAGPVDHFLSGPSRVDDFYVSTDPVPEHALLLIEISDTTLATDHAKKLPHYVASGIPEFWIEDLKHDLLLVYRKPVGNEYRTSLTFRRGDSVSPLAFPDVVINVSDLLG